MNEIQGIKIIPGETIYGLYGSFYENPFFEGFLLGNHGDHVGGKLNFMGAQSFHKNLNEKPFHSARWQGRIKIPEDATYLFNTSDNSRVCIQLEDCHTKKTYDVLKEYDATSNSKGKMSPKLKKGIYKILIEYIPIDPVFENQNILTLYWESAKKVDGKIVRPITHQVIPKENLLMPDYSDESSILKGTRETLFEKFIIPNRIKNSNTPSYYDSNKESSPLSEQVLNRLRNQKVTMIDEKNKARKQYQLWDEARKSELPSRTALKPKELEKEQQEISKKVPFDKRTIQTWDAKYWDPDVKEPLDPDYDENNPYAKHADADGDGLSNYDSTHGFTVIGASHVPWLPEYDSNPEYKNYPKYICSYRKASTAGDPYTDLQKALGNVNNLLPVTKNPLIAAVPCVSVQMEGYSLSKIEDITVSNESGTHFTTSNRLTVSNAQEHTKSEDHSEQLNGEIGMSKGAPSISIGGNLGWSHGISDGSSHTNSVESASDSTTDHRDTFQRHWNKADTAYFNANVRYVNSGTASILRGKPSLNFGIYNEQSGKVEPVASVVPPEKTAGEVLNLEGDSYYPSQELMPLVIQTKDTFNSQRITLSQKQLDSVLSGYPMRLEVPQVDGEFQGKISTTKDPLIPNINKDYKWTDFFSTINNNTARLTLVTPDGKIYDRRIAAPVCDENKARNEVGNGKPNRIDLYADKNKVPLLKIGQAIQIAFGKNQNSFIFENKQGIEHDLNRANVNLILSEKTSQILQKQEKKRLELDKKKNTKTYGTYYDLDLYQGMQIVIEIPPVVTVRLTDSKMPNDKGKAQYSRQIMLKNNYINKSVYYTIKVNPPEISKNNLDVSELSKTGVLKPGEECKTGLEYVSDQDVLKVFITTNQNEKSRLLFSKSVAKLPGFITEKPRVDQELVKKAYKFSSLPWFGDAKCKGITFSVSPKEQWDNISSFYLTIETIKEGKLTKKTYGPILKTQLDDKFKQETEKNGEQEYTVDLDFSLFKTWNEDAIQLGDKITLTGKINEVKKRVGWEGVKACKKGEICDLNNVYIPYEEPRTITLYEGTFPTRLPYQEYQEAFKVTQPILTNDVPSLVNSNKVNHFNNILKELKVKVDKPIFLGIIKDYKVEFDNREAEVATLEGHRFENGELQFSFKTTTTVKQYREHESDVPVLDGLAKFFRRVDEIVSGADLSHDTYNAAIPGLIGGGRKLKIIANIDERALLDRDLKSGKNSIVLYDGQI
ncbi:hypothetical protein OB988_28710 [Bacillus cereus]|nr:hypothetical protein [Bacillus cereus]